MIKLKRIYEQYESSDGVRILIGRFWPRGISKEKARLDLWLKDIAPSEDLCKWFGYDLKKWETFQKRYGEELAINEIGLGELGEIIKSAKNITFLFSAKDTEHNEAVVLRDFFHRRKETVEFGQYGF